MEFTCGFCNKIISKQSTLYFGFDYMCCSNHCRSKIIELNLKIDPLMNNPHKWSIHKLKNQEQNQEQKVLSDILRILKL